MISIFKNKTESRINQSRIEDPTYQVGQPVPTELVYDRAVSNPFFLSLNNMSPLEGNYTANMDHIVNGISVMTKTPGVSRVPWTHISPKHIDGILGGPAGKWSDLGTAVNEQRVSFDLLHSSFKFKTPTVFATYTRAVEKNESDELTGAIKNDISQPSDGSDHPKNKAMGKLKGEIPVGIPTDGVSPFGMKPLDIAGTNVQIRKDTGTSAGGQSIKTGTKLMPSESISQMTNPWWQWK